MRQTFSVTGLNCQSCVNHVTKAITGLAGVQQVSIDLEPTGTSTIHVEVSEPLSAVDVQAALADEGDYSLLR